MIAVMKAILLGVLLVGTGALAAVGSTRVQSRSIMDSCEFVYRTESDVRVYPEAELYEIFVGAPLYVKASFKNAWNKGPARSEDFVIPVGLAGFAEFSFESMSTSASFLFRDMSFEWGVLDTDKTFVPLSDQYHSDIGRDFGQVCHTVRGPDAKFVDRQVD
jgi:hypothetical protein